MGGYLIKIVKEELGVYRSNEICIYLLHVLISIFSFIRIRYFVRHMKIFSFFFRFIYLFFFLNCLFALNICSVDV